MPSWYELDEDILGLKGDVIVIANGKVRVIPRATFEGYGILRSGRPAPTPPPAAPAAPETPPVAAATPPDADRPYPRGPADVERLDDPVYLREFVESKTRVPMNGAHRKQRFIATWDDAVKLRMDLLDLIRGRPGIDTETLNEALGHDEDGAAAAHGALLSLVSFNVLVAVDVGYGKVRRRRAWYMANHPDVLRGRILTGVRRPSLD